MENPTGSIPPSAPVPPVTTPVSQGSSNRNKIILIVLAVLAVLCLAACLVGYLIFRSVGQQVSQSVEQDPAAVEDRAGEIADFTLPAGFASESSFSIMGMEMAIYNNPSNNHMLALLQMPMQMPLTDETMDQMSGQMQSQTGRRLENVQVIDDYETTIRGADARVFIYEGDSEGETYRQMVVVFEGKSGTAMLTVMGRADTWDQSVYDALIASIQ